MEEWEIDNLKRLREERKTYLDMVKYCTDNNYMLNNALYDALSKEYEFDIYCGTDRTYWDKDGNQIEDENEAIDRMNNGEPIDEIWDDIYQFFIIDENSAEFFARYTNELVFYNEDLNLYFLCVCHWGTAWDYVPSNWKELPKED